MSTSRERSWPIPARSWAAAARTIRVPLRVRGTEARRVQGEGHTGELLDDAVVQSPAMRRRSASEASTACRSSLARSRC